MMGNVIEHVEALMREAAAETILPRFRRLAANDIEEKEPGEWVTAADLEAERVLTAGLAALAPGSIVIGEEAVAANVALLSRLGESGPVWLVDPLDGTANFAAGKGPFAVMVALLRSGTTVASWILDPLTGACATAEVGGGAFLRGRRITAGAESSPLSLMRGAVFRRFLPQEWRIGVERWSSSIAAALPGSACAGHEYPAVVGGRQHFALFWWTLAWDHAPGVLFAHEAGAAARRLDGGPYIATDQRPGLLIAQNDAVWEQIHSTMVPYVPLMASS